MKKKYFRDMMHSGNFNTTRLDAFSDGVLALVNILFAIAIYLLIPVIYFFAGGLDEN